MKTRLLTAILGLAAICVPLWAGYSADDRLPTNPKTIEFQHDGRDVSGFAIYVKKAEQPERRIDLGILVPDDKGWVRAPLPSLPDGVYQIELVAYNAAGESTRIRPQPDRFAMANAGGTPPSTSAPPHVTPTTTEQEPKAPAKKAGFFKRLATIIVGDDDPE